MEQNKQKNSRKRLNSLILLVAFTAIMLIVSTYAWFSTQKNVTIGGLYGKVNVAEGLQISLDALNWRNEIDLSAGGITQYFAQTNAETGENYDLTNPYAGRTNVTPTELLPASTTAQQDEGIGLDRLNMYWGENTSGIVLTDTKLLEEEAKSGYYAIDLFLQNSSAESAVTGNVADLLKLETNSSVTVNSGKGSTGLQNTLRVAFALFDNAKTNQNDVLVSATPTQSQILGAMVDQKIIDVAIWEPNASGDKVTAGEPGSETISTYAAHVDYIVQNNNNIKWSVADGKKYFGKDDTMTEPEVIKYAAGTAIPTYALTNASTTATEVDGKTGSISNIYDWATPATGLEKQVTLQTPNTGIGETALQLLSVTSTDEAPVNFSIAPGEYHKMRMYVWLEGQDVDCINYASLGGGLTLNIGLSKPGTAKGS